MQPISALVSRERTEEQFTSFNTGSDYGAGRYSDGMTSSMITV
jgi:hypothetical protein